MDGFRPIKKNTDAIPMKQSSLDNLKPPWKKGEVPNPKGRPPLTIKKTLLQLKEQGFEAVTAQDVKRMSEMLVGSTRERLEQLIADQDQPIIMHIVAKAMLNDADGFDNLNKILNRAHGMPVQQVAGTDGDGNATPLVVQIIRESIPKTDDY